MAPLYNRYVPPKPAAATVAPAVKAAPIAPKSKPAPIVVEQKRKRERSEDEKAERKAKKLRKKGIEEPPAPAEESIAEPVAPHVEEVVAPVQDESLIDGDDKPLGEFAHIKNIKKRRKLEKEARKLRKEAGKAAKAGQDDGIATVEQQDEEVADGEVLVAPAFVNGARDEDAREEAAPEPTVSARKEEKKRKKRRKQDEEAEREQERNDEAPTDGDTTMADASDEEKPAELPAEPPVEQPKKRRHKLEAVLQPHDSTDPGPEDDEHLRKHTSLMAKFQKSRQLPLKNTEDETMEDVQPAPEPQIRKRDLAPFPQPVNEPKEYKPTFSALPNWLAEPTTVPSEGSTPFSKLGLASATVEYLAKLGFKDALPVQQALVPLLLPPGTSGSSFAPGTDSVLPDVAVSAATGSGKTIAYLLPMIEALKQRPGSHDRLHGLVVVPTRELVMQVAAVAESLVKGSSLRIGIASGTAKLKDEQQRLIKTGRRYDPAAYAALMQTAQRRNHPPPEDSDDFDDFIEELETWTDRQDQELQDAVRGLVDHVPTYTSAADVLICTPGRLLEHLSSTLGFSLSHTEWLVLDEADKLLDQQYDGFLQQLDEELSRPRSPDEQDAREKTLRAQGLWDGRFERRVRKVVLSATMTRDISKLTALRLKRPKLVVVQGTEEPDAETGADADETKLLEKESGVFELPSTLKEYCVPVGDGAEKPLHLLELLRTRVLVGGGGEKLNKPAIEDAVSDAGSDTSSSDNSDSDLSSSDSSSSSDESSSNGSDENTDVASSNDEEDLTMPQLAAASRVKPTIDHTPPPAPTILIFTSSTESATRLSHLLQHLQPSYAPFTTTLTKTTTKSLFPHPPAHTSPIIVISTDRAARGLDTLASRRITHVLQYDVPRSLTSYVHRVGRTARAGRRGEAWTLYSEREARWFVNEIQRSEKVRRAGAVERVRVASGDERMKERFAEVLEGMRGLVFGTGGK